MAAERRTGLPALRVTDIVGANRGRRSANTPVEPVTYAGEAAGDPDWGQLPDDARRILERAGIGANPALASYSSPPQIRRDRGGNERVSVLAWRVEAEHLWLVEAARAAEGDGKLRRGKGTWGVRVAAVGDVTLQRATMLPVPLPEPEDPRAASPRPAAPSAPPGYGGRVPEVWANLPARVRDAVDAAVPALDTRVEHGAARLWYLGTAVGTQVIEKLWYDRHGRGAITGVFSARTVPTALDQMNPDAMRRVVFDAPWDVVAFRARVEWRGGVALTGKNNPPLPEGLGRLALSSG